MIERLLFLADFCSTWKNILKFPAESHQLQQIQHCVDGTTYIKAACSILSKINGMHPSNDHMIPSLENKIAPETPGLKDEFPFKKA